MLKSNKNISKMIFFTKCKKIRKSLLTKIIEEMSLIGIDILCFKTVIIQICI